MILQHRFPLLSDSIRGSILSIYTTAKLFTKLNRCRALTLADLIKFTSRVSNSESVSQSIKDLPTTASLELVFREAFDCLIAHIASASVRSELSLSIGEIIEMTPHRVEFFLEHYIPTLSTTTSCVTVGRTRLEIHAKPRSVLYASTAPSMRLLEQISGAVDSHEPILLVGETGTGKTTAVQTLAALCGQSIVVLNMSQASDSSDLLGGFRPLDTALIVMPLKVIFDTLFIASFSEKGNTKFLASVAKAYKDRKWDRVMAAFASAVTMAKSLSFSPKSDKKRRKVISTSIQTQWNTFESNLRAAQTKMDMVQSSIIFAFIEGALVKAIRTGAWILLDEINLATADTLQSLASLLNAGTLTLLERGDTDAIKPSTNFRLFACMNPATDAGKSNLPPSLRSRFTELWVDSPDSRRVDLLLIIKQYLRIHLPPGPSGELVCADIADFHIAAREGVVFDGADLKVHYSMRTLTRAMSYACFAAPMFGLRRAVYEGCIMTYMTGLCAASLDKMTVLISATILSNVKRPAAFISQIPRNPRLEPEEQEENNGKFVLVDCFWLEKGPIDIAVKEDEFILTPSVQTNLTNLARGVLARNYPVLIQGPTSAGKTSMVEYLAKLTGHRFIRINNHEHTDLQEYIGGYMSNDDGHLVFQEVLIIII